MSDQHNGFDFVKGALIGGVLGSVAALLSAPKSGRELRDDIVDTYNTVNHKSQEVASNFRDKRRQLARYLNGERPAAPRGNALIKGGIAGLTVGAIAALLLARKSGKQLRRDLNNQYAHVRHRAGDFVSDLDHRREAVMENVENWKDTLASLIDKATAKKRGGAPVSEIAEWANLGLRLYQQFQNRR